MFCEFHDFTRIKSTSSQHFGQIASLRILWRCSEYIFSYFSKIFFQTLHYIYIFFWLGKRLRLILYKILLIIIIYNEWCDFRNLVLIYSMICGHFHSCWHVQLATKFNALISHFSFELTWEDKKISITLTAVTRNLICVDWGLLCIWLWIWLF